MSLQEIGDHDSPFLYSPWFTDVFMERIVKCLTVAFLLVWNSVFQSKVEIPVYSTITTIAVREATRDGFKFFPWVFLQKWTLQISPGIDVSTPSLFSMSIDVKFEIVAETAWLHFKTILVAYSRFETNWSEW